MTKDERNFNIPRGTDEEYEAIRNSLRQRIQNYESTMPKQKVVSEMHDVETGNVFQPWSPNPTNSGAPNAAQPIPQQNMSFQQYRQNLGQETQGYQSPFVTPKQGAPSPFKKTPDTLNFQKIQQPVMANASHSKEPVTYKPKQRKSAGKTFLFLILLIAIILGLSWALREFVFQAYEIPSGSMEKTIMTGDMVFAEKVSYKLGAPKAGDIVTFNDPLNDGRILIKRVIATEGQVVDIRDNKLYINGVEQYEDYVNGLPTTTLRSSSVKYPYVVPAGQVWVMGDNRTNSQDSRYFGSIPVDSVIGQALVVYWPVSDAKNLI